MYVCIYIAYRERERERDYAGVAKNLGSVLASAEVTALCVRPGWPADTDHS